MTDNDNKHFQDYLNGSSDLSKAYKTMPELSTPGSIDDSILKAARNASAKKKHAFSPFASSWAIPVSLAAVLVITIAGCRAAVNSSARPRTTSERSHGCARIVPA